MSLSSTQHQMHGPGLQLYKNLHSTPDEVIEPESTATASTVLSLLHV